jgi:uncharacterized protein (TIGR02145 family)
MGLGKNARFWSTADVGATDAVSWVLEDKSFDGFVYHEDFKASELNVRCVSDD